MKKWTVSVLPSARIGFDDALKAAFEFILNVWKLQHGMIFAWNSPYKEGGLQKYFDGLGGRLSGAIHSCSRGSIMIKKSDFPDRLDLDLSLFHRGQKQVAFQMKVQFELDGRPVCTGCSVIPSPEN